jgi:uncharacterized protein
MADFLGVGWAFRVGVDARGRIAMARGERDIEEAIYMILLTPQGQRVMRPEFGCRIHDLIFAPNDATTVGLATYYVEDALGMWEPRITVLDIKVRADAEEPACMWIDIQYQIKATADRRSLVFPFYRIPEEQPGSTVPR